MIATFKNFGPYASGVQVELDSADPSITIIDGVATLGDVASGALADTSADPFTIEISSGAQTGSIADLTLHATSAGGDTWSDLALLIGRFDYLVWDPTDDQSSGPVIAATLADRQYTGALRQTLPIDRLDDYATLWVSLGVYAENYVVDSDGNEGPAIVAFMNNGGNVYLEGADVWAYDPQLGGFDFAPHFSLGATQDGTGDLYHVVGVAGTIADGMDFLYVGENSFIDHLQPVANGVALLGNSAPAYTCGVAGDTGTYRTVGASFELGGLDDGVGPSTKADLARVIMDFFGVAPKDPLFADGFETGDASAWSAGIP